MSQVDLVPLWKALAHPKRHRIILMLGEKARTTGELCTYFDVSRFAVMRHLKVLEQAGFIVSRREGRQRWNFLNEELLKRIQLAHLENGGESEYQLNEVVNFLARQEGTQAEGPKLAEQTLQKDVSLQATPDQVFKALTGDIDRWWSYRITSDSHVQLEPWVGGRFYETFNDGGGALYAIVTYLRPGEEIRLNGSMGLAEEAAGNLIQISLKPQPPDATRLQLTHRFLGKVSPVTLDAFKSSWEELLTQQLKRFVEHDNRFQDSSSEQRSPHR
jgi:DNA-binding transcriptional ArsR family regulator/uncharacterized protein YndB with AHSA1/START domain